MTYEIKLTVNRHAMTVCYWKIITNAHSAEDRRVHRYTERDVAMRAWGALGDGALRRAELWRVEPGDGPFGTEYLERIGYEDANAR